MRHRADPLFDDSGEHMALRPRIELSPGEVQMWREALTDRRTSGIFAIIDKASGNEVGEFRTAKEAVAYAEAHKPTTDGAWGLFCFEGEDSTFLGECVGTRNRPR